MTEVRVRERLPRDLTWLIGLVLAGATYVYVADRRLGLDAHAYWGAWRGAMYGASPDTLDAYLYSPAFAEAIWPIVQLPWPVFGILWASASIAALAYCFAPLGWRWTLPLLLCCTPEILTGNIFWLLAVVAAYGLRYPALWAVPALTKVTPALGPLWFLVRREWRALAVSVGVTLVVAAASALTMPDAWSTWLTLLRDNGSATGGSVGSSLAPPLLLRLPLAVALTAWCAHTDRRWGLPVGMVLATPVFGIAALAMLAALPRLADMPRPAVNDMSGEVG